MKPLSELEALAREAMDGLRTDSCPSPIRMHPAQVLALCRAIRDAERTMLDHEDAVGRGVFTSSVHPAVPILRGSAQRTLARLRAVIEGRSA